MMSSVLIMDGSCVTVMLALIRLNDCSLMPSTPSRHSRNSVTSSGQSMPSTRKQVVCFLSSDCIAALFPFGVLAPNNAPSLCAISLSAASQRNIHVTMMNSGTSTTPLYAIYPKKPGIGTPDRSAIALTMKFGPLPM